MRREVDLGDRKVTIVGTAHVSEESRKEVEETIWEIQPDLVCVELDQQRFESLRDKSGWKDLDVAEAIRGGKGYLLFLNLVMSIYQRRIGLEQGMSPGQEMLSAVEAAEEKGIEYSLVDRDINETFERLRSEMGFREKLWLLASFLVEEEDYEVEDLKQSNILDQLVAELEEDFPSIKKVFLDERNRFMAEKILEKEFEHAVAVVGAAHLDGIAEILESGREATEEENAGSSIPWMKIFHYGFPLTVLAMLGYSFYKLGFATGLDATKFWILSNGILAMLGAIIARSHPLTWLISFFSAPLTSLDPALGAGMVASYAEGKFYPPKVEELESIAYIDSYRELWGNQVGRILLTFVFVTIGSAVATFLSAGYIASLIGL